MIQLGSFVTDKITGFSGIVTAVGLYLSGFKQALVQPKATDASKMPKSIWIDMNDLVVDATVPVASLDQTDTQ